jgi:hypothetical protein
MGSAIDAEGYLWPLREELSLAGGMWTSFICCLLLVMIDDKDCSLTICQLD